MHFINPNQGPSAMRNPLEDDRYAIIPVHPALHRPMRFWLVGRYRKSWRTSPTPSPTRQYPRSPSGTDRCDGDTEQKQKATRALQVASILRQRQPNIRALDALEKRRAQRARHNAAQQKADAEKQIQKFLRSITQIPTILRQRRSIRQVVRCTRCRPQTPALTTRVICPKI